MCNKMWQDMGAQLCSPGGDVVCDSKKGLLDSAFALPRKVRSKVSLCKMHERPEASIGCFQRHWRVGKAQPQEWATESSWKVALDSAWLSNTIQFTQTLRSERACRQNMAELLCDFKSIEAPEVTMLLSQIPFRGMETHCFRSHGNSFF